MRWITRSIAVLAGTLGVMAGAVAMPENNSSLPPVIAVGQAKECDRPQTSEAVVSCLGNELRQSDVKINDIYQQLTERLDRTGRKKLRDEQRAWLKERDEVCILVRHISNREQWLRDVLTDYRKTVCVTRYTQYRAVELEKMLSNPKAASLVPPQTPPKTEQSKYQITSPMVRNQGHWYFDVTIYARDIALLGFNALWLGCWEGETNTSTGMIVYVRDEKGAPGKVIYGFALDLDAGRLYISMNGAWQNGEPGSGRGIPTKVGGEYRCGVESTVPIAPLIEHGLMAVNYGIPHSFPYRIPSGFLSFDQPLGNFVSYRQMELHYLSYVWPEQRNYKMPRLPSLETTGMEGFINAMAASYERGLLALGYEGGDVSVFDLASGSELRRFKAHPHRIGALRFSQSGNLLFSRSEFETVAKVWNIDTGEKLKTFEVGRTTGKGAAFDYDIGGESWIFASEQGPLIYNLIWDKLSNNGDSGHAQALRSVAVDSMSHRIVGGGGPLILYEYGNKSGGNSVQVKKLAEAQNINPSDWVVAVAYASDKRSVYSVSEDGQVNRWDARDLSLIAHYDFGIKVYDVSIRPDNSQFVIEGWKRKQDGLCADQGTAKDQIDIIVLNTQDGAFRRVASPIMEYHVAAYLGPDRLVIGAGNQVALLNLAPFQPPKNQPDRNGVGKLNSCSK